MRFLLLASLIVALCVAPSCVAGSIPAVLSVTFPGKGVYGNVCHDEGRPRRRTTLKARGTISFPANWTLSIYPNLDGATDSKQFNVLPAEQVKAIYCTGLDLDDANFANFARFVNVTILDLNATDITDKSIDSLLPMTKLKSLDLSKTFITRAGLSRLDKLKNLEALCAEGVKLGPGSLKLVRGFNLKLLKVGMTGICNDDLKDISGQSRLYELQIGGNPITNDGLNHILNLKNMQFLDLTDSRVTALGLLKLKVLPQLKMIKIRTNNFSQSDRAALATQLPSVKIVDPHQTMEIPLDILQPLH